MIKELGVKSEGALMGNGKLHTVSRYEADLSDGKQVGQSGATVRIPNLP
jgi:hypothetical protein